MNDKTPNPKLIAKMADLGAWEILRVDTGQSLCVITAHSRDEALGRARYVSDSVANMPPDLDLLDAQECTEEIREAVATQSAGYFLVFEFPKGLASRVPIQ